ncbi:MAG TPA: rod shape-determining protein [Gaiellaceae bacterium]|nr:rod shape-determining protein [Gaiellaceae bacterium]
MRLGNRPSSRQLAVDLGTANTVVFRRGEGVVLFEPSVVAIDERTREVQAVGADAWRMIGRTPAHIKATRPLRHGVIADFETTEQMLRHFIRRVLGGSRFRTHVIVCVPSGITPVERSAVEQATLAAGATHASLIDEPLAAAIGAGLPVGQSVGSMIVDIGGGTSEIAVTALGGLVVAHSIKVGGYELDDAIVKMVEQHGQLLIGQEQAERLKLEVGSALPVSEVAGSGEVAGRDPVTGMLRRVSIDAVQVRGALERPLTQIVDAIKNLLEQTPPELSADIANHGLSLVGGGALLRGFDELIRRETGLEVHIDDDPLTTVARGAGTALEELDPQRPRHSRQKRRTPRFR